MWQEIKAFIAVTIAMGLLVLRFERVLVDKFSAFCAVFPKCDDSGSLLDDVEFSSSG